MFGIIGSLLSGGMTGIFGSLISRFFEHKNKKLDRDHELNIMKAEAELMKQEWAQKTELSKIEGETKIDMADSEAFKTALTSEPKLYSKHSDSLLFKLLDVFRGSIRPVLTIYLCVLTTLVYVHAKTLMGTVDIPVEDAINLVNLITNTILYLTTSCVLFWFGTRQKSPPPTK